MDDGKVKRRRTSVASDDTPQHHQFSKAYVTIEGSLCVGTVMLLPTMIAALMIGLSRESLDARGALAVIFIQNKAHVWRLRGIASKRQCELLTSSVPDSRWRLEPDTIDGEPSFEVYPIFEGRAETFLSENVEGQLRGMADQITPHVIKQLVNNDNYSSAGDVLPCTWLLRRYNRDERMGVELHRDVGTSATATILLTSSGKDYAGGAYVRGASGERLYFEDTVGDVLLYGPRVRHGVHVTGVGGRFSLTVWFQPRDLCGNDVQIKVLRTFMQFDVNRDEVVSWGEVCVHELDFDHDDKVSDLDTVQAFAASPYFDETKSVQYEERPHELKAMKAEASAQIRACDTDCDGAVSVIEFDRCYEPSAGQSHQSSHAYWSRLLGNLPWGYFFPTSDRNGDGKLSKQEFKHYLELIDS